MTSKKDDMYIKTVDDFKQDLAEQIYFLQKSAADYDNGDFIEAKRMSAFLDNFMLVLGLIVISGLIYGFTNRNKDN